MGGQVTVPLDERCLKPLKLMSKIADDDEYWDVLFARDCVFSAEGVLEHIPAYLPDIMKLHPGNVIQLCHRACVKLLDLLHRVKLNVAPPQSLATPVCLITETFVWISLLPNKIKFFEAMFEDCGVIPETLAVAFPKMLCLSGLTVVPKLDYWCSTESDDGLSDPIRLRLVELLLLLRMTGYEVPDFPAKSFAFSVMNAILSYHARASIPVKYPLVRRELIWGSLALMFMCGSSFMMCEPTEDALRSIFAPLFSAFDTRKEGVDDCLSFALLLSCHLAFALKSEVLDKCITDAFVVNMCHVVDVLQKRPSGGAAILVMARLMQSSKFVEFSMRPCHSFPSSKDIHEGTWGSVILELVTRAWIVTVKYETNTAAVFIGCKVLATSTDVSAYAGQAWFTLIDQHELSLECYTMLVETMHWVVSRAWERPQVVAIILRNGGPIKTICDKLPDNPKAMALAEWIKGQNEKLRAMKEKFTVEDLIELLGTKENCLEMKDAPEACPELSFDLGTHYLYLYEASTRDFMAETRLLNIQRVQLENGQWGTKITPAVEFAWSPE